MDSASLNDIKKALQAIPAEDVREHLLRLAKYKKENKELLSFILFLEEDIEQFSKDVKREIDLAFQGLNSSTAYFSVKGLRKTLKFINKYIKFSASKKLEAEWLIYFCSKMRQAPIRMGSSVVITNLYNKQLERIYRALDHLHEDIQADYRADIRELEVP